MLRYVDLLFERLFDNAPCGPGSLHAYKQLREAGSAQSSCAAAMRAYRVAPTSFLDSLKIVKVSCTS